MRVMPNKLPAQRCKSPSEDVNVGLGRTFTSRLCLLVRCILPDEATRNLATASQWHTQPLAPGSFVLLLQRPQRIASHLNLRANWT